MYDTIQVNAIQYVLPNEFNLAQGPDINELLDQKQKLMYERDNLVKQVVQLRKEVTEQAQQHQQSESQRAKLDTELNEIRVSLRHMVDG